jgi:hypothetical protein
MQRSLAVNSNRLYAALAAVFLALIVPAAATLAATDAGKTKTLKTSGNSKEIDRGRYMVLTGHCNNCHTAGYAAAQGSVDEKNWLTGNPLGNRGPWGTTYGSNLRLSIQSFTADEWVAYAKVMRPRPPMPWWSVHETSARDLRAMYKFIKHLGPAGEPSRPSLPPEVEPPPPFVQYPAGAR